MRSRLFGIKVNGRGKRIGGETHMDKEETPDKQGEREKSEWLEVCSAILMSFAVIATAWCSYQAARWNSRASVAFAKSNSSRSFAVVSADEADRKMILDVDTFLDFVELYDNPSIAREALESFKDHYFTDRLRRAVDAWTALDPRNNPDAPRNPFELPDYVVDSDIQARAYFNLADGYSTEARDYIRQSNDYTLLTVLFAVVLFFAGVSAKYKRHAPAAINLIIGSLIFYVSLLALCFQSVY